MKSGDIVETEKEGESWKILKSERTEKDLFMYEAGVEKVIDGDTLKVVIEIGFGNIVRLKLRLRGLDCPEINTLRGKRAQKFVEGQIAGKKIVIVTSRVDKYDRYLSDVFLEQANGSVVFLNNHLLEKGFAEIKTDWSFDDWKGAA